MTATDAGNGNVIYRLFSKPSSIAPLVVLRIVFGGVMLASIIRFAYNGWIADFYISPQFFFSFIPGLEPLPGMGMYVIFALMALAAFGIMLGAFYRISAVVFFTTFTYVELLDKTYYLNHYYFISIIAFMLIWVPAHRAFSLDSFRKQAGSIRLVPAWTINVFKLQLALVYIFAGLAKINPDWLLEALPLKIWLPARGHWPVVGPLFSELWVAYAFSWAGMLYDVSIVFFLMQKSTRKWAYLAVVIFHVLTRLLFPIGMFPFIMIGLTLIFFSEHFQEQLLARLRWLFGSSGQSSITSWRPQRVAGQLLLGLFLLHFAVQLALPFRHVLYPGRLFWTEQGYRFSWRVMLMEKAGMCTFYLKENDDAPAVVVDNAQYLTRIQEHMMATQPDMILQFAHYLRDRFASAGEKQPQVYAQCVASLQGARSRPLIDPDTDLAREAPGWNHKKWILPFEN